MTIQKGLFLGMIKVDAKIYGYCSKNIAWKAVHLLGLVI